ncbi:protein kinase [uncultured Deinococcus sp.]|uniref:protein kinase domain-containing protein n=1 Tax=uncultured Deinococcus sp. TaxID=158789 RepID=UPI00258A4840|nr:protein kinase [uncultured Deinococcus sp.]
MSATGTIFEGFRLLRPLGQGWLGQVFTAQNLDGAGVQALRVVSPELVAQPGVMTQFRRLFAKWRRLSHPNVLLPDDLLEREQHVMYAMPLAQSGSVRQLLQSQVRSGEFLDLLVAVDLARQAAGAVAYAHEHNLMHGDLKPENLLLTPARALLGRRAYGVLVSDFGVAELQAFTHGTHDRQIMSAPAYMAPEQFRGVRSETRSDLYALGVILYELLTNLVPFETRDLAEAMDKHQHVAPIPPGQIRYDIPSELEEVVLTCMAKAPQDRYRTAAELEEQLQRVMNTLLPQGPQPTVVLPDIPEPPAPRIEPLRDRKPYARLQICDAAGQLLRVEPLTGDVVTIGRAPGNSIVLEHAGVSRHHLSLDLGDEGEVHVTELGSTNGTTLGGEALPLREALRWPDGGVLRVEPFWLRLQPPQRVVQQARIALLVEDNDLTLDPGATVLLPVKLSNTGRTVDHFRLEVEGVPAEWVQNLYHEVQLNPGMSGETTLKVQVPRVPTSRAQTYDVRVIARSRENPAEYGTAPMKWTVQPFTETVTEFKPVRRSAWRRTHYQLHMVNVSNVAVTYAPTVGDDEGEVKLEAPWSQIQVPASGNLSNVIPVRTIAYNYMMRLREGIGKVRVTGLPETLTLEPGAAYDQRLDVRLPMRWIAAPRPRTLQYHPNPDTGVDRATNLSLLHLPLIPLWALPIALLAALGLGFWLFQEPRVVVTVDPQSPVVGQPFTLKFQSQNATRIDVQPFGKTVTNTNGTLLVPQGVREPTNVQLIVHGRIRNTQASVQVQPKVLAPVLRTFTVTPQNITPGQQATVRWDVEGVQEVNIEPLGTVPAKGEQRYTVEADTTFRLSASNGGGQVDRAYPVKVLPAAIELFQIEPAEAAVGQTVTLRWRVRNAQSVTLEPLGSVASSGQTKWQVKGEQAFVLRANVSGGAPISSTQTLRVPAPVIETFQVTPAQARIGDPVTVTWKVRNAPNVTIDPLGAVEAQGQRSFVMDTGNRVFRLQASNGATTTEQSYSVSAQARVPSLGGVEASPRKPRAGSPVTLTWSSQDAQSVELTGLPQGTLSLSPSGSTIVAAPSNNATLTFTARGSGGSASRSLSLPVLPAASGAAATPPVTITTPVRTTPAQGSGTQGGTRPATTATPSSGSAATSRTSGTAQSGGTGAQSRPATGTGTAAAPRNGQTAGTPSGAATVRTTPPATPAAPVARPQIVSFGASAAIVKAGQITKLSWQATGVKTVKVFPQGLPTSPSGSLQVRPARTTTYTLVAGTQTRSLTVVVIPRAGTPTTAPTGNAPQGSAASAPAAPAAQPQTQAQTPPAAPATAAAQTAVGARPSNAATVTIDRFEASETTVSRGTRITLSWDVSNSNSIYLTPGIGKQSASGSVERSILRDTVFKIEARRGGQVVTRQLTVKVE